ncbi:DUF3558 family protein [Micromonospora sp. WMMD1120]|uniref:DUF3558 family protein n=1 Tax=Micromonospora sp. WMMD1120 TaxID=3016106 RepID=UPI002417AE5C|nr:DUF3558 family protein [Micromonospora sp. WMMD1120]MDG4809718.1 DUF3558 family protein [Micromonospora sp. WMMD1120]
MRRPPGYEPAVRTPPLGSTAPRISATRSAAAIPVAVMILALTGCGTADPAPPPSAVTQPDVAAPAAQPDVAATPARTADPCALVPKAAAERLAGTPLQDPVAAPESCTYTAPVSGPTAQVEVYVGAGAKKILDIDRDLGHDLRPVTGVGDEAHIEDGAVFVAVGGTWVAIRLVTLADPAASRQALEDLARDVVTRL